MLIDTHAHINFKAYETDAQEVIARAYEQGVLVVNVGTQLDTSKAAVELAEKYQIPNSKFQIKSKFQIPNFQTYAVVGLHPVHTYSQHLDEEESSFKSREEKFDYEAYKKLADNPLVVGIGECGLDYYRLPNEAGSIEYEAVKQLQKEAFIQQIKLAQELNKALVIHCRPSQGSQDAYEDIIQILDTEFEKFQIANSKYQMRFEIHSFTGSPETVQEFIKRGAYVGLNGIITFDRTGNMEKVVKTVPLDRIVLETDSPYLTPKPHRGKRNEPAYVQFVAEHLAGLKEFSVDEVAEATTQNAKKLFLF